jgi:hypothetical protein
MADTDDELQSDELDSDQRDDDTAKVASERRRAAKRVRDADRSAEAAGLTLEEAALRREDEREQDEREEEDLRAERLEERTVRDQRELEEDRDRRALQDGARALELANVAEDSRDHYRQDAGDERWRARVERARGNDLLDESATRRARDEPGAEATAAAGRAHHRRAADADRWATNDERDARERDSAARSLRAQAAEQAEAPAVGAVQNPPPEPPVARTYRKPVERKKKQQERDTSGLPDLDLGGR